MRKKIKQVFTFLLVSAIVVPSLSLHTKTAEAARTNGTAPYINQWSVSGPFTQEQPLENVVPVIGESFADPSSSETSTWQYFDDRIFNRNYDDYNDLMGYFDVKQGQDTTDKWVVAATYVYSPKAQTVQWQVGGSGVYKLFTNDTLSGQQTQAASRVSKSGTKYPITLKQGWNKLLIEIQHKNPGTNRNFLGFYTRLSDNNGNEISGLTYSVTGPNVTNNQLKIVTKGLAIDKNAFDARNANVPANDYPSNTLPYAYDENPYVWMDGKIDGKENTSSIAPQASPFTFQAAGGDPGYTWGIVDGALPPGLTLASDGHMEGTVADGAHGTSQKDYTFTVKVTDAQGVTATQPYTITVKQNPVDWFIQGKMSALSHTTGTMPNLYDPNYNYDEWAQTAKEMGMTMLSTETIQNTVYYWPSPNANLTPSDSNKLYKYNALYQAEDGTWKVKDRVMQAKQAAERYGLKFGVYLSSQYEGKDIIESDIQGLVARYNPWYVFADGNPQDTANVDVAWSSARNYNDRVLIDANPDPQTGDQDITLHERPFWHSEPYNNGGWGNGVLPQTRKVAHEEWNDPYTTALDVWIIYANGNERDHWPEATKELINQYGHGYVMNYDSSITVTRGMDNLSSNLDNNNIFAMVPISSQQLSDMRTSIAKWMANAGGPDLHESLYGTMPYTMDYTIKSGWYTDPQKAIAHGQGPDWGYAMSRDQVVYLHMIKNLISGVSKTGFTGQASMSGIGPFNAPVNKVEWLNKGISLPFTTQQSGGKYYITIDTSSVVADPIDTILKITTEDKTRNFAMTSVKLFSSQTSTDKLQLRAEPYMNDFTNVFAPAALSYSSDNTSVATVDSSTGLVRAVGDGKAIITVTATYDDGVNAPQVKTDTYPVKVSGGMISAALPLVGVNMSTDGNLFWGQFSTNKDLPVTFQGFTQKGGTVDIMGATNIKYHYATVDGNRNNPTGKIIVTEVPADQVPFVVNGNTMHFTSNVASSTMYCYWADITVDGKTYTTTRNYITLIPDVNVAAGITPTVTSDSNNAGILSDGIINDSTGGNRTKWVAPASDNNPSMTYDLGKLYNLTHVNLFFNHHMPNADYVTYYNVPNKVKMEYSVDGINWKAGNETNTLSGGGLPTSRNTLAVPKSDTTLYAWEQDGLYYNYPVDPGKPAVPARYVRISFPGGGQGGSPIDILEAQVFSSGEMVVGSVVSKVIAPTAITGLPYGTAKTAAALGLPSSVALVTNSGNVYADVTWNVDAASYDPSVSTAQTFTVSGTVTLPSWVVNPNNVPLTTSISVSVKSFGKVEAEDYIAMSGIQTEDSSEGTKNVGWTDPGDWMDYTVNVPSSGNYKVNYRVAVNAGNTGSVNFLVDGVSKKITSFPSTGGWQNWTTVSDEVNLTAGTHTIRLGIVKGGWNLNWFELVFEKDTVQSITAITAPAPITGVANGTAKTAAALGLPQTVKLVTDAGSIDASVAWNVETSSYDPSQQTEQTFTVSGTVTLPVGVVNPNNIPLTTSISVTVLPVNTTQVPTNYKAMWGFNSNGNDNSPNRFNATLNGTGATYSSTDQKEGSASLSLDGSKGSYASASLVTTNTDNMTLSAWVKWNGATSSAQQILVNGNTSRSGYSIFLDHGNSDKVSLLLSGKAVIGSDTVLPVGQWTNITTVRRNGTWELYINGKSVLTKVNSTGPNTPDTGTYIGGNQNGAENFNGFIDAARIYDTALSPSQLQAIANEEEETGSVPVATWSDAGIVTAGQPFELKVGLSNITQIVNKQVYAQDLTLHYDPSKLQFESVASLKDGFQVIEQKETAPGQIRIVAASVGANVPAQGELLSFKFTAKSVTQATQTTVSVDRVVIAGGQGHELQVGGASRDIQISIPSTSVDKSFLNASIASAQAKYDAAVEGNGDGQYAIGSKAQLQSAIDTARVTANDSNATQQQVDSAQAALDAAVQVFESRKITADVNGDGKISIGDLAIIAGAYGKQQGQAGWNEKADVNHDGKVDIEDLAIVARAILK
ncbi:carbohydrate-binding protein [Paenibacillus sp. GCM10027629]|uniref:carbohydrate-binding protein n=1 Tax=Paenibacillus sp. GCM10027629 TaxID=3273414 RepID=UPI003642B004